MARLQTVIDVFEKRSAKNSSDADEVKVKLAQMSGDLEERAAENEKLLMEREKMLEASKSNSVQIQSYLEEIGRLKDEARKLSESLEAKSSEVETIKVELGDARQQ